MSSDVVLDLKQEVLNSSNVVREVAGYLNISQSEELQLSKNLPLSIHESSNMFNRGAFGMVSDKNGKRGEISLRSGEDPEAWIEEVTHYIHTAGNLGLQQNMVEIHELYEKSENDVLLSVNENLAVAERAQEITIEELDNFALRTNLKPTHEPQNTEDVANAINIKIGSRMSNGYFEGGMLSGGQAIRINSSLDSLFGKPPHDAIGLDVDHYLLSSKALIKISEEPLENRNNEEIRVLRERKAESQGFICSSVADKVGTLLENPENVIKLEQVFTDNHVAIDSVTYRLSQIDQQINSLDDDQAIQCLLRFLNQSCQTNELLYISQLIPGRWTETYEALRGSDPKVLKTIQTGLIEEIKQYEVDKMAKDPREILRNLVKQTESVASAQAGLETSLLYLMDDLPVDEITRSAMLGNPEYVKAYINATLKALKSGEYTPLNIKLDPRKFSQSENNADSVAQESLTHAFSEPEAAIFFQELVKRMDYKRFRSSNADILLMYGNWQLDMQFIADGVDITYPVSPGTYANELKRAKVKSYDSIRQRQEMDTKRHLRDVLVEPVAKIVVAQKLGKGIESVVFPENMMGGYSELLKSRDSKQWINRLWLFVETVHKDESEGGRMMLDFIRCNSIAEQMKVVNEYLKQHNYPTT